MKESKGKENAQKKGVPKLLVYALAAVVLLAAGALLFAGYFTPAGPVQQPGNQTAAASAEKLLLSSFDAGASLVDYEIAYTIVENGVASEYHMIRNGENSWVNVLGDFGQMEGFFGKNESYDVVCLTYNNLTRCAMQENNSDFRNIAASLKVLLPDAKTYLAQKDQLSKLIAAKAITFTGLAVEETVGPFAARKITYSLDYKGLTVNQLNSIGIAPNDPAVTDYSDQRVSFWVDGKTGLVARSLSTRYEGLKKASFESTYSKIYVGKAAVPVAPGGLIPASAFAYFYASAVQDYAEREACARMETAQGRDSCFKSMAVDKASAQLCRRIESGTEKESCLLIVAQYNRDASLCAGLAGMADDCYIAVAGETGDFELCKNLKNAGLAGQCASAAAEGVKKAEAEEAQRQKLLASKGCGVDSDCKVFGNIGQYCAPANSSDSFPDGPVGMGACFAGLPCACSGSVCSFAKNETYYACVSDVERAGLEGYLKGIAAEAEAASKANSTNSTN